MIITFYSFKGGTGRSMALVNVGEAFAKLGLRVLLLDFDLEAPSLETYYPDKTQTILDSPGIVDLIESYKRSIAPPGPLHQTVDSLLPFEDIRSAMINVRTEVNSGAVHLIPVGKRSADDMGRYVNVVGTFDWKEFYDNWEGELYFRWLRQQFHAHADVTLVDCRTGITDVGAIGCGQIADAVVLFSTMNVQQISGSEMMVSRLSDPRLAEMRDTPVKLIVIPSRVDFAEIELLNNFRQKFKELFEKYLPEGVTSDHVWSSKIPFVPYYSYGNHLAVRDDRGPNDLTDSYRRLAELLSRLAPEDSPLFTRGAILNASNSSSI